MLAFCQLAFSEVQYIKYMKKKTQKKLSLLVAAVALATYNIFTPDAKVKSNDIDYYVAVVSVSDGDTFRGVSEDGTETRFRMQGIDAPETGQAFSKRSKAKLSSLILGKRVGIRVHKKKDGFGRPVVWVETPNGLDAGEEMLKSGMAWHFKNYDNAENYNKLEQEARNNRVGLWKDSNPTAPWEYRKSKRYKE